MQLSGTPNVNVPELQRYISAAFFGPTKGKHDKASLEKYKLNIASKKEAQQRLAALEEVFPKLVKWLGLLMQPEPAKRIRAFEKMWAELDLYSDETVQKIEALKRKYK
jgi:hypothetical protein